MLARDLAAAIKPLPKEELDALIVELEAKFLPPKQPIEELL